jgi:hypothetical protein
MAPSPGISTYLSLLLVVSPTHVPCEILQRRQILNWS